MANSNTDLVNVRAPVVHWEDRDQVKGGLLLAHKVPGCFLSQRFGGSISVPGSRGTRVFLYNSDRLGVPD